MNAFTKSIHHNNIITTTTRCMGCSYVVSTRKQSIHHNESTTTITTNTSRLNIVMGFVMMAFVKSTIQQQQTQKNNHNKFTSSESVGLRCQDHFVSRRHRIFTFPSNSLENVVGNHALLHFLFTKRSEYWDRDFVVTSTTFRT